MRFLLVLVLVGSFLVDVKAEDELEETSFIEDPNYEPDTAEEVEDPLTVKPLPTRLLPTKRPLPTRPPPRVQVPLYLSLIGNPTYFKQCYCFRRVCYVPGLYSRFYGWQVPYKIGYVVYNNWIYRFYPCKG